MQRSLRETIGLFLVLIGIAPVRCHADDFSTNFSDPPSKYGMTTYWIWFGPAITRNGIDQDLLNMKRAYISGVTILPVYPLALDDEKRGIKNYPFLSPDFLDLLKYAANKAHSLHMTVDVTMGTGWPYGGPWINAETAARKLRMRKSSDPPLSDEEVLYRQDDKTFVSIPTRMQVKRAALGDEGLVLDHYSRAALQQQIDVVGEKLLASLQGTGLRAFWCDSLEVYDSNWTTGFLPQFRRQRGYDLKPQLPLLFGKSTSEARQVRHDFWHTLSDQASENFYRPLQAWCHEKKIALKAEPYGQPPVALGACRYVDLPVGEHYEWRMLNATRWAASGGHLFGKNMIETEAWTWTGIPNRFADSLEDLKVTSDMHFVSGANSLMAVSYVNAPVNSDKAHWVSYWGPWINERQSWWPYFPLLSRYVQRVSWLLQQGKPVADVALYLPIDDVFAATSADHGLNLYFDVRERLHGKPIPEFGLKSAITGNTSVISTLLNNGYQFDCIDSSTLPDAQIDAGRLKMGIGNYGLVVLPGLQGMPLDDLKKLAGFVRTGGKVIATKRLPDTAYSTKPEDTEQLLRLLHEMFSVPTYGRGKAILVKDEKEEYLTALKDLMPTDLQLIQSDPDIAFVHRRLSDQDYYFVVNLCKIEKNISTKFSSPGQTIEVWDPMTGALSTSWDGKLHLVPFGSMVYRIRSGATLRTIR